MDESALGREVVAVVLCLLGSAFFSGSETALTALSPTRLEALRKTGGRLRRAGFERWRAAPQAFLVTILIGNNLVNVLASALATTVAYRISSDGGLASAVGVMTLGILVFGEITPKSLAQAHADRIAGWVVAPLVALDWALRPVTLVLGLLGRLASRTSRTPVPVTKEDVRLMLSLAHRHRQLPDQSRELMEAAMRFREAVVREVMVPRPMIDMVDLSWSLGEVRRLVASSAHTRFPVIDGAPDELVGLLHAKHLLQIVDGDDWRQLIREPFFIPETRPAHEMLQAFREAGQHMAFVLDEFGGFEGVVTLEDVLELLIGEIEDEFDRRSIEEEDGTAAVPGHLALRRLEKLIGRPLEQPAHVDSVGGLVASLAEKTVTTGTRIEWQGLQFEVLEMEDGRARRVLVTPGP